MWITGTKALFQGKSCSHQSLKIHFHILSKCYCLLSVILLSTSVVNPVKHVVSSASPCFPLTATIPSDPWLKEQGTLFWYSSQNTGCSFGIHFGLRFFQVYAIKFSSTRWLKVHHWPVFPLFVNHFAKWCAVIFLFPIWNLCLCSIKIDKHIRTRICSCKVNENIKKRISHKKSKNLNWASHLPVRM